ncbi:uncharacterized protein [Haliotis cracherodii]|uniref:uncharacterized protein n=1 Tax=Haliotis cracherodii TaxID=6455 RepID=UPI0039EB132E
MVRSKRSAAVLDNHRATGKSRMRPRTRSLMKTYIQPTPTISIKKTDIKHSGPSPTDDSDESTPTGSKCDNESEQGDRKPESESVEDMDETEHDTEELGRNTPEINEPESKETDACRPLSQTSGSFNLQSQETFILNPSTSAGCVDDLDPLPTITPMPSMFCDMEPTLSHNRSLQLHRNLTFLIARRRLIYFQDEEQMRQLDVDIAKLKGEIQIMNTEFQRLTQKALHTRKALGASGEHGSIQPKPKLKTWRTI